MTTEAILGVGLVGIITVTLAAVVTVEEIDSHNERKHKRELEDKKYHDEKERKDLEEVDKKAYYDSMTSADKAAIEVEKEKTEQKRLEKVAKEAEARTAEAHTKEKLTEMKDEILTQVRHEAIKYVKEDSKDIFNTWVTGYESKIDRKISRIEDRLDDVRYDAADDDDLKDLRRKVDKLSDKVSFGSNGTTPAAGSSPNIIVQNH